MNIPPQCFKDLAVFPTIGFSNGPHHQDGTFGGVMMQCPHDDNCTNPVITGSLTVMIHSGLAEFYVTPSQGQMVLPQQNTKQIHNLRKRLISDAKDDLRKCGKQKLDPSRP
eukprot:Selendium_serpulae@DN5282_c0_g1_i1.p2